MVDRKYIRRSPCQQPQITGEDFCMEKILVLGESSSLHCYSKSSWASLGRKCGLVDKAEVLFTEFLSLFLLWEKTSL